MHFKKLALNDREAESIIEFLRILYSDKLLLAFIHTQVLDHLFIIHTVFTCVRVICFELFFLRAKNETSGGRIYTGGHTKQTKLRLCTYAMADFFR